MISIGQLGTKTAGFAPGRAALIGPGIGVTRTFGQLADRTDRLARALTGLLDAGPGHRVAALSQNCVELMELYLAAAKAGTMLFPLNWRFSAAPVSEARVDATPAR